MEDVEMNNVEKYVISKEDFEKYFGSKSVISKEDYFKYLREKLDTLTDTLKYKK
jgi:hypothetical protein